MHFQDKKDLPEHIKRSLPEDIQELYKNTYNDAFDDYENDILAHKVAWASVEQAYPKDKRRHKV